MAGQLWCWGDNSNMSCGDPTPGHHEIVPTRVGTRTDWKHVATGGGVACAMKDPPAQVHLFLGSDAVKYAEQQAQKVFPFLISWRSPARLMSSRSAAT